MSPLVQLSMTFYKAISCIKYFSDSTSSKNIYQWIKFFVLSFFTFYQVMSQLRKLRWTINLNTLLYEHHFLTKAKSSQLSTGTYTISLVNRFRYCNCSVKLMSYSTWLYLTWLTINSYFINIVNKSNLCEFNIHWEQVRLALTIWLYFNSLMVHGRHIISILHLTFQKLHIIA